jgi:hypothetical protein
MSYSYSRKEGLLNHIMMNPITFLLALFMLTQTSNTNQQSNVQHAAVGYNECLITMPADNEPVLKDSEINSEPQNSSPAIQTFVSGKCANNVIIIL